MQDPILTPIFLVVGETVLAEAGVFAIGGSTLVVAGVTVTATQVGAIIVTTAIIGLDVAYMMSKQPKPGNGLITIRQPNPVRQGGYGRTRIAPSYLLYDVGNGQGTKILSLDVYAFLTGRLCAYRTWYAGEDIINGTVVSNGQHIYLHGMPDGRYTFTSIEVEWRYGFPVETALQRITEQRPDIWTNDHRGDGVATVAELCQTAPDQETQSSRFPGGKPELTVEADLYPIWDPRDPSQSPDDPDSWVAYPVWDSTHTYAVGDRVIYPANPYFAPTYSAGTTYAKYAVVTYASINWYSRIAGNIGNTPGADLTKWIPIGTPFYSRINGNLNNKPGFSVFDVTTRLSLGRLGSLLDEIVSPHEYWTNLLCNPVLQVMDYLTDPVHGMGLDRDILITPQLDRFKSRADLCDTQILNKTGNLESRYLCSLKFNFDDDPAMIIGQILATCDGWLTEDGDGSIILEVGVYETPSTTITIDTNQILDFTVNYGVADEQIVNELNITFADPFSNYKMVAGEPWVNQADIDLRGITRSQPLELQGVNRHSQARRLAKRALARLMANQGTVTLSLFGLALLGVRWANLTYALVPGFENGVVVELSNGNIDFLAGKVTFNWTLVNPVTIDAWDPITEEGDGPQDVLLLLDNNPPSLIFNKLNNSMLLGVI